MDHLPETTTPGIRDSALLCGWLFADLLLALAVIFLAGARGAPAGSQPPAAPVQVTIFTADPTGATSRATSAVALTQTATPAPTGTPTPAPAPSQTPPPVATPQPAISGQPVNLNFKVDSDALRAGQAGEVDRTVALIRQAAAGAGLSQRAGIVLTFGLAPSATEGGEIATAVNRLLAQSLPDVFEGAALREFHYLNSAPDRRGEVIVEVYVFVER